MSDKTSDVKPPIPERTSSLPPPPPPPIPERTSSLPPPPIPERTSSLPPPPSPPIPERTSSLPPPPSPPTLDPQPNIPPLPTPSTGSLSQTLQPFGGVSGVGPWTASVGHPIPKPTPSLPVPKQTAPKQNKAPPPKRVIPKPPPLPDPKPVALPGGVAFEDLAKPGEIKKLQVACESDPTLRAQWIELCKTADTDFVSRQKMFEVAYKCSVNMPGKNDIYEPEKRDHYFKKLSELLEDMPIAILEKTKTWEIYQGTGKGHAGFADANAGFSHMDFGVDEPPDFSTTYACNTSPGQALADAKAFEVLVKHELGHNVATMGDADGLVKTAGGGAWKVYASLAEALDAEFAADLADFCSKVETALGDGTKVDPKKIVQAFEEAEDTAGIPDQIKTKYPKATSGKVPADHKILAVMETARAGYLAIGDSPPDSGGRVLISVPALGQWQTFDKSAYAKRISNYQYNSDSEWFAEYFTTVNNKTESVRKAGESAYPDAYAWLRKAGLLYH